MLSQAGQLAQEDIVGCPRLRSDVPILLSQNRLRFFHEGFRNPRRGHHGGCITPGLAIALLVERYPYDRAIVSKSPR